ncbi:SAM-dependent chlorinase/fluorinase [Candidatus Micrarchaeota archaeon]|nr:SAM-dependent chlorinase/fluorinase [Candidatus Micrarchaeota archaeon]
MVSNVITLSSDFEKQSQGIGNMEGAIYSINPEARVIHLMHGIPSFDINSAARTMETIYNMPIGFHVCVVDPGVGTKRRPIIVKVKRGDFFIGPDNGCLLTAPRLLGGIEKAVKITNDRYMIKPVSPIFHGRGIFAPAAGHLSLGIQMGEFGTVLEPKDLAPAPYEEAKVEENLIKAKIIHINKFGSLHLNILQQEWDKLKVKLGDRVEINIGKKKIEVPFSRTFGDVKKGELVLLKDDYMRITIALNMDSFAEKYLVKNGDKIEIRKT